MALPMPPDRAIAGGFAGLLVTPSVSVRNVDKHFLVSIASRQPACIDRQGVLQKQVPLEAHCLAIESW